MKDYWRIGTRVRRKRKRACAIKRGETKERHVTNASIKVGAWVSAVFPGFGHIASTAIFRMLFSSEPRFF